MSETIEHSENSSLPDGWYLLTVNEIKSDKNYSCVGGPFGSNLTTADYVGSDGVPVIRGTNLSGSNNRFKDDGFVYVCEKKADSLRQNMAFPNDLIFTQRGTLGQVGHIPNNARFSRYVVSQSQMKLTVSTHIASTDYIYHYFSSPNVLRLIENSVEATGVPHITLGILKSLPVPLPPLPQQRKIARILTTVDNLIEKTEALIEKYKAVKQGMMHDLFTRGVDHNGKLRPHYEEAPHLYKESPLGWIPKEWEVDKFKNLTSVLTCGLASTPTYVDETEGVAFLSAQNVSKGRMSYHKFSHIPLQLHRSITKYNKPQRGDILYIRVGNNMGEAANVDVDWDFSIYVSLTLIRMNDSCSNVFYKHLLNSIEYKRLSKRDVFVGGGVGNLNVNIVREFDMLVPSLPEQDEIAQRLDSSDEFMRREEATLSKYQLLKTGLMQDLLTGNVRVKVDEVEEELANA